MVVPQPKGQAGPDGLAPGLRGSFTVEFWLRTAPGSTGTNTLVRLGRDLNALRIGYRAGRMYFEFSTQRASTEEPVLASDLNAWAHYAFVYDADAQTATIYRNGVVAGYAEEFATPLDAADTSPLYLGGDPDAPGQFFDVTYAIPKEMTRGKSKVTVRLQGHPQNFAGGLFGCRVLKGAEGKMP